MVRNLSTGTMSERRWWTLPKMFGLPLWQSGSSSSGHTDSSHQKVDSVAVAAPAPPKACEAVSSDDEDLEEFLEKQRSVRLGHTEVAMPSPAKSNRKYSTSDEKFVRSKSRRRSSRSSSKSSGSTKYSSFSKASDNENDKAIKETIYETGASQISFSFFNDNDKPVPENTSQQLYDNITEDAIKSDTPVRQSDEGRVRESSPAIDDDSETIDESRHPCVPADLCENNLEKCDSPSAQSDACSKERHVTKLTILLSSVRPTSVEAEVSSSEVQPKSPSPEDDRESISSSETDAKPLESADGQKTSPGAAADQENLLDEAAQINALYSVVEKCSHLNAGDSVVDEVDYAELGEFQQTQPSPDQAEVPNMEYCNHRARVKTRLRKISLRRKRQPQPSLKKMNVRLNRAWRSLRGWWHEEKSKLSHLRSKSVSKEEETMDSASGSRGGSCSDKSFYEALKKRESCPPEEEEDGGVDEDGYCSLEPRRRRFSSVEGAKVVDDLTLRRKSCISELSAVRRYPPHPPPPRTSGVNAFRKSKYYPPQGQDGFEDLRRYIKQGGDFCKELSIILQERSEAELQYAKTLSKLSNKLLKVSKEAVGTVSQAWHKAGIELETTSEIHKTFATALCEEVVKPLKQLLESQHRIRKSVENAVDKTGKNLSEWRAAESKSKKHSFVSARENEKLQDITLDVRLSGGLTGSNKLTASSLHLHQNKQGSEKESSKLETKRKKAEELVKKSDVEYYTYCLRAERARLEWETAVVRGSQCFQALEEERLQQLKHLAFVYWQHCRDIGPKLTQSAVRLKEPIESCDVSTDIKTIASTKGVEQPVSEQLLPDFYAEHTTLAMNRERRRQALVKVLQLVVQDLERERRGKNGVENLARAFKQSPNFGNVDSQQNVSEKLHHMRFMLTYLEAARYKLSCALAELDGKPKPSHPLASHIHVIRDRQGFQQSILKVPPWVHKETIECTETVESPEWTDRGTADGNSVQPDSDFDEFSSQGSSDEKDFESNMFTVMPDSVASTPSPIVTGKCKALYSYTANLYDELNLEPGDIINIHDKQPDGWWLGELNGVVGIFPATYVEEIS